MSLFHSPQSHELFDLTSRGSYVFGRASSISLCNLT
uniref:Uncharacterized protein n=1 Tax=Ciona intestinalis TaxID=7719 RepID=H2XMB3_CIOIN